MTALFADIVGSTTLAERLSPDEVKLVIGEFVGRMTRAVEQYGGFVQAYMGDGIAAFFGASRAHENDAERAARAALGIVAEVKEYGRAIEGSWQISDFNVRVGINTGPAAVGLVGGDSPQPVAVGDTTNVAARLQTTAEPGEIVVGEATAKSLIRTFALEPLGEVTVKGRHVPVSAWRLIAAQAALQSTVDTPIVGREAELAELNGILAELANGRGQIAVLLGEAGLGKTRLVAEQRRHSSGTVTWLEGHCLSYGTEVIYGPFIQILRNWIGAEDGEAELSMWTKLHAKLGLLPAAQIPDVLPFLARVLSLRIDPAEEERLAANVTFRSRARDQARLPHVASEPGPAGARGRGDRGHPLGGSVLGPARRRAVRAGRRGAAPLSTDAPDRPGLGRVEDPPARPRRPSSPNDGAAAAAARRRGGEAAAARVAAEPAS